ncbi:MAG TPA: hypothetical protein VF177_01285 [Anaerolineae bacterium]
MDIAIWSVVLHTIIVYVAVLIGLRLSGKREIGQMAVYDLAGPAQGASAGSDGSGAAGCPDYQSHQRTALARIGAVVRRYPVSTATGFAGDGRG